ncbi:hypothetical protein B0I03_10561 [Flavobacterium aquaticum]|uniref:Uncharacterized protein n=1 Tax=Flavobacterium aquaticum TaxID=1236486 RepID=A0A327YUD2_9FLAO|nr:hypothetical protein [Flavobacterium aquaticum]RAK21629.1 hypothetical protein B0I03_10561 [Flavobacterium aquaticum]
MKESLSPCIVSWAKYAIGFKKNIPLNSKKASLDYWVKVIDYLLSQNKYHHLKKNREKAIQQFNLVDSKFKG